MLVTVGGTRRLDAGGELTCFRAPLELHDLFGGVVFAPPDVVAGANPAPSFPSPMCARRDVEFAAEHPNGNKAGAGRLRGM